MIYATREGHARRVAEDVAATPGVQQRRFDLIDAARIPEGFSLEEYSAAIVIASVHMGKHKPEIVRFVKDNAAKLNHVPSLFLSVSLSEVTAEDANAPPERRAQAQADVRRMIDRFLAETGWRPSHAAAVAGALTWSRYNFVIRFVMTRVAKKAGAPVDTTRDYEFTDWKELHRLVEEFAMSSPAAGVSGSPDQTQ